MVLAAILMVVMVAMLAFSVDIGYMMAMQAEMDRAVDSAALAGAGSLIDGVDAANMAALDTMLLNSVGSQKLTDKEDREDKLLAWLDEHKEDFETQAGHWDPETKTFAQSDNLPSAIQVKATYSQPNLFFSRIFSNDGFSVTAEAVARYQPRDIVLVLDFSGSMNDDSELQRIAQYGSSVRATIEDNLRQIYDELGQPVYGDMQFDPVYVSSTDMNTIKEALGLRYAQTTTNKRGKKTTTTWVEVPYPYPSGSWDDYINYVKSSSNYPARAGYQKKYGYLTLINYWLEQQPGYNQTPDLWKVSAQPVQAVKDAVSVFMDYIQEVPDCDDRVGLVVYNSSSGDSLLEKSLTSDYTAVETIVDHRQAGHYDSMTNIGAGIRRGWEELKAEGRIGAKKMIVLMTDGQANEPNNTSYARQYALDQAAEAKSRGYQIFTISLGNGADTGLMNEIAEITGGTHFNIPGGSDVTDYGDDLLEAFRKIADARPLLLVK